MTEFVDNSPAIDVDPAEYNRLLGYPRGHVAGERSIELAEWARNWYESNGRPWIYAREADALEIRAGAVQIESASFTSKRLSRTLREAEAHSVILIAASAGPEAEREANRRWLEEKPDEYFFLETYASAVVEHLLTQAGARLCAWAEQDNMAILPHSSPGYAGWNIIEQHGLLGLLHHRLPEPVEALESGALRPKKSILGVFGVTRQTQNLRRLPDLVPCESCSFSPCQYRRKPFLRGNIL